MEGYSIGGGMINGPSDGLLPERLKAWWDARKKEKERHESLKAQARPLEELIVSERFRVEGVTRSSINFPIRLAVTPLDGKVQTRTLYFETYSTVSSGDIIVASMPAYQEVLSKYRSPIFIGHERNQTFYLSRPLKEEEIALEISVLEGEKMVRTEHSIDYFRLLDLMP